MNRISDLTKDMRKSLEEILIETVHDIADADKNNKSDDIELIEYENYTFYYRVVYLFMHRAILYYEFDEMELWIKKELLKETVLPKIEDALGSQD